MTELITHLMEAREERELGRLEKQLSRLDLLVLDELGYVPASKLGAELLFDVTRRARKGPGNECRGPLRVAIERGPRL